MLSIITIGETEKWDSIVKRFSQYDVYYLSGYVKPFQAHGDGDPVLFYYEDGGIRAINVVMKRDVGLDGVFSGKLPEGACFDITTPYGYGGFLIEGATDETSMSRLDAAYSAYCKSEGIICEFARFHPVLKNSEALTGLYDVSRLGKTVTVFLDSREVIWDNFSGKNRNRVRKAQHEGVEIFWGRDAELFQHFRRMYNATMDRDNAVDYYYFRSGFYDSLLHDLKYNSLVFYAAYEGKPIAMAVVLFANQQVHCHLLASEKEQQPLAPNNLLLYQVACWGQENGYKTLHIGGGLGCSESDSLYRFKSLFNKHSDTTFEVGRRIFDPEKYEELVAIGNAEGGDETHANFFPKYRAYMAGCEKC